MAEPQSKAPTDQPSVSRQLEAAGLDVDDVLATPEAAARMSTMLDQKIAAALKNLSQPASGDAVMIQRLADALSERSNRESGRVTLSADVLAKQEAARQRMGGLIMERRAAIDLMHAEGAGVEDQLGEWPLYQVMDEIFLQDFIIKPFERNEATKQTEPVFLHYDGVPNAAMLPMNEHAERIHAAFAEAVCTTENSHKGRPVDVWITANGLCMKGESPQPQRHRLASLEDGSGRQVDSVFKANAHRAKFGLVGQASPGASKVHVLGTIAPAASQNYRGAPDARAAPVRVSGAQ